MKKTSGNPTLDKNLECINKYNSKLADEILNLPCLTNNIELVETDLKEPNLLFNGVPLHSPDGAENEVKDVFNTVVNTKLSVHIVFGMGLGYLFQKACEMSKGNVFLYEPNLEILRVTLELVDFSKELTQKNVFVMSDFEEFRKFYLSVFKYKTSPSFLSLNSYINLLYADNIKNIQQHLHEIACDYSNAIFQQKVFKRVSYKNVLKNIAKTLDAPPLMQIKGICKSKSALVISPGPTLDFNIEIIKKNRNKFVIFSVGQAVKALYNAGIEPDFVCILEAQDCSGHFSGLDLSNTNLILAPYTHSLHFELKSKNKFIFATSNEDQSKFWGDIVGVDISPYFLKGSVSYMALECAKMLGCKQNILVGQDLAYLDNKCYSSTSAYAGIGYKSTNGNIEINIENEDKFAEASLSEETKHDKNAVKSISNGKIVSTQENLGFVKGIDGKMLPTHVGYVKFVEFLEDFAKENKNLDLINTSMRGAQIDGFKNIPLEEVAKNIENNEKFEMPKIQANYSKTKVFNKLKTYLHTSKSALDNFALGKNTILACDDRLQTTELLKKIEDELVKLFYIYGEMPSAQLTLKSLEDSLIKQIPKERLDIELSCIQELLPIYQKIFMVKDKSLLNANCFNDMIEIEYLVQVEDELTPKSIVIMFQMMKNFFFISENEVLETVSLLENAISVLSEK